MLGIRLLCAAALLAAGGQALADDAAPTIVVKKAEVAFHLDVAGAFDAKDSVEIAFKPQVYGDEAEVEEVHAPGAGQAGAGLVRFKSEKIDEAIRAAERDLAIAKAALAVQVEEQKRQLDGNAVARTKAEFDAKTAQA